MFRNLGWPELVVIAVLLLLIFGAKRLPEIGKALGASWRELVDSLKGKDKDSTS